MLTSAQTMPTVEAMSKTLPAKETRNARTVDGHYGRFQTEITIHSVVFLDGTDSGTRTLDKMLWDNVKARVTSPRDRLQLCNSTTVMEVSTRPEPKSQPYQPQLQHPRQLAISCTTDGLFKSMMLLDVLMSQTFAAMEVLAAQRVSTVGQ